jgi:D-glycero-D-manno-heptose 1,7-bisphosphate phosphatase
VFLDRDGVINANRADYVLGWDQFSFLPGALKALALLHAAGTPAIVVTNQTIVGKGLITSEALDDIHDRMRNAVQAAGGAIHDILHCPHLAGDNCACRKPRPGMLHMAAEKHAIELVESYYVGDALTDLAAGQSAGCRCVLVETGRGRTQVLREEARFHRDYHAAGDLLSAVKWILVHGKGADRTLRPSHDLAALRSGLRQRMGRGTQ